MKDMNGYCMLLCFVIGVAITFQQWGVGPGLACLSLGSMVFNGFCWIYPKEPK